MNHFFNLQSFKWWPTRELGQGKTHQSGGKKKMQKTIRGRGEKEGKKVKNNNDANPIE
jgi:hypothetical protein